MTRLFRRPDPGLTDYAGLMLFGIVYLAAIALVLSPGSFIAPAETADLAQD